MKAVLCILALAFACVAAPSSRAAQPAPESAYIVAEITDLAAALPAPVRVKALTRRDGRVIARILWPDGDRGASLLLTPADSAVYFPRADLLVASPPKGATVPGGDLAGALALGAAGLARSDGRPDRCAEGPCLRFDGTPPPGSRCARLLAWRRADGSPLLAACLDPRGARLWELRFEDAPSQGARSPRFQWIESGRLRARGRILYYEPGAPAPTELFTREGLRRWR